MNHPLYKMVKFEVRPKLRITLKSLIINVSLLTYFVFTIARTNWSDKMFILVLIFIWISTSLSYHESTRMHSMQLYHLIPVSLFVKFISKQLTVLVLLVLFLCLILLSAAISKIINGQTNLGSESFFDLFVSGIFAHSFCTMGAIFFKKNKEPLIILSYVGFKLFLGCILFVSFWIGGINGTPNNLFSLSFPWGEWTWVGLLIMSAVFYVFSYHLFKKRQL